MAKQPRRDGLSEGVAAISAGTCWWTASWQLMRLMCCQSCQGYAHGKAQEAEWEAKISSELPLSATWPCHTVPLHWRPLQRQTAQTWADHVRKKGDQVLIPKPPRKILKCYCCYCYKAGRTTCSRPVQKMIGAACQHLGFWCLCFLMVRSLYAATMLAMMFGKMRGVWETLSLHVHRHQIPDAVSSQGSIMNRVNQENFTY